MTPTLRPSEVESYRRDGVLAPIRVLAGAEVARFRAAVEDLEARAGGPRKPAQLGQPQLHHRWAWDLATHPAVLDAVEGVLGPNILVHSTSIFSKPPRSRRYVSWHQDGAYWRLDTPAVVSAWIALTDSTVENGCMRVLPGSHARGVVPFTDAWGAAAENMLASGLEVAVEVDERLARDVVLAAGEMSLHHVDLIHGSSENRSADKRIGFAVRYVQPRAQQGLEHHEVVLARGRDDHHHYTLKREPPTADVEAGLAAQLEFSERHLRARRSRAEADAGAGGPGDGPTNGLDIFERGADRHSTDR